MNIKHLFFGLVGLLVMAASANAAPALAHPLDMATATVKALGDPQPKIGPQVAKAAITDPFEISLAGDETFGTQLATLPLGGLIVQPVGDDIGAFPQLASVLPDKTLIIQALGDDIGFSPQLAASNETSLKPIIAVNTTKWPGAGEENGRKPTPPSIMHGGSRLV